MELQSDATHTECQSLVCVVDDDESALSRVPEEDPLPFLHHLSAVCFDVMSLIPSSLPTCLFKRPDATNDITCCSRGVSEMYWSRSTCVSESRMIALSLRAIAFAWPGAIPRR
jgi:hypothetical protein